MITYTDQGMILFLNSLKPSVGKELNYLFAKLYCCITSNNGSVPILKFQKFQNCQFEKIEFKVSIIMLIA